MIKEEELVNHLMMNQDNIAFPSLFENEDGTWLDLSDNSEAAFQEARIRKEIYEFDTPIEAERFAKGSWKESIPETENSGFSQDYSLDLDSLLTDKTPHRFNNVDTFINSKTSTKRRWI